MTRDNHQSVGSRSVIQRGQIVGPYQVIQGLKGRGGMAHVFEVEVRQKYRRSDMPRRLVMKVADEEHQAALVAEADFLRRFEHPNVVRIFPLPLENRRPVYSARERFPFGWGWYYTMEMLDGGSLQSFLTRPTTITDMLRTPTKGTHRLSVLLALGIARQIAQALEHIHERHVINLDVKPGNILFRRRRFRLLQSSIPQAVLCDFGIARDLRYPRAGILGIATPEYVSPEQLLEGGGRHQALDARSDIFSLGVVLYEMLTGQLPFENIMQVADPTHIPPSPREIRPAIPQALEDVVMHALAKDPRYRFQTATEMRMAIESVPTPLDWKTIGRYALLGAALSTCLTIGVWGTNWLNRDRSTPTPKPPVTQVVETPTPSSPSPSPTISKTPTAPPAGVNATATLRPTHTPTPTPRPITPTPPSPPTPGG